MRLPILFCAFMVLILSGKPVLADPDFVPYRERGIVVAQASNMAPMSFVGEDGQAKGFIVDFWQKWSAETGVPVKFHLVTWGESMKAVRDGRADVHGGLFLTAQRESFFDFSTPFFDSAGGLYVRKGSGIREADQLDGRRVGVIGATYFESYIQNNFPEMIPVRIKTTRELAEKVLRGELDAFMGDYPTVMYQFALMGKVEEFDEIERIGEQYFQAAVAEGNSGLLSVVEEGVVLVDQNERDAIFNRWVIGQREARPAWLAPAGWACVAMLCVAIATPFVGGDLRRRRRAYPSCSETKSTARCSDQ